MAKTKKRAAVENAIAQKEIDITTLGLSSLQGLDYKKAKTKFFEALTSDEWYFKHNGQLVTLNFVQSHGYDETNKTGEHLVDFLAITRNVELELKELPPPIGGLKAFTNEELKVLKEYW